MALSIATPADASSAVAAASMRAMTADARFRADAFRELQTWRDSDAVEASDEDLMRFLLACEGSRDAARDRLRDCLAWRRDLQARAPPHTCAICETDTSSHSFLCIGVDSSARPIIYGCPARASHRDVDATVWHVVNTLDLCLSRSAAAPPTGSPRFVPKSPAVTAASALPDDPAPCDTAHMWVWAVDYSGFGFSHAMQGSLALSFLRVFSTHMPERLGRIILMNPPRAWDMLLAVVSPFLDVRTRDKLVAVRGTPDEVVATLARDHGFGASTCAWLRDTLLAEAKPGQITPLLPEWKPFTLPGLREKLPFSPSAAPSSPVSATTE